MTLERALQFIEHHGIVLEAGRGPAPSLASAVLGPLPPGSWWAHPRAKEFFWLTRAIRDRADVLVCRLLDGKITYVHRRLWRALVRLSSAIGIRRLDAVHERHTDTGTHQVDITPFPRWVPADVRAQARAMSRADAEAALADAVPLTTIIAASSRTPRAGRARAAPRARIVRRSRSRR